MKNKNISLIIVIVCLLVIVLEIIFGYDNMDWGFWLIIISSVLIMIGALLSIRAGSNETTE